MTSKPSITNCPKLSLACSYFPPFVASCRCPPKDSDGHCRIVFFPGTACLRWCQPLTVASRCLLFPFSEKELNPDSNQRNIPGGYCGGVPPLPIPNREVKPACADGTAMQCGRVGGRLLSSWRASGTEVPQALLFCLYKFTS